VRKGLLVIVVGCMLLSLRSRLPFVLRSSPPLTFAPLLNILYIHILVVLAAAYRNPEINEVPANGTPAVATNVDGDGRGEREETDELRLEKRNARVGMRGEDYGCRWLRRGGGLYGSSSVCGFRR